MRNFVHRSLHSSSPLISPGWRARAFTLLATAAQSLGLLFFLMMSWRRASSDGSHRVVFAEAGEGTDPAATRGDPPPDFGGTASG